MIATVTDIAGGPELPIPRHPEDIAAGQVLPDCDWTRSVVQARALGLPRLVVVTVLPFGVIAALIDPDGSIIETAAEPFSDESETQL